VALVRREMSRSVMPLTRPLMNVHSAIPVLSVMNFHPCVASCLKIRSFPPAALADASIRVLHCRLSGGRERE